MDTTTIEIRAEQKDALDDLKASPSESYKDVLQRLMDAYEAADDAETPPLSDGAAMDTDVLREVIADELDTPAADLTDEVKDLSVMVDQLRHEVEAMREVLER